MTDAERANLIIGIVRLQTGFMMDHGYITPEGQLNFPAMTVQESRIGKLLRLILLRKRAEEINRELEIARIKREGPRSFGERSF
jgi:hypothetical protein